MMPDDAGSRSLGDVFDRFHGTRLGSSVLERLWSDAYGDDYPAAVRPNAFYSLATLERLTEGLRLRRGDVMADLGCGHGGAGLWMARRSGASLIGIDLSPGGIEIAAARARDLGFGSDARFMVGDLTATGLRDASCDAAVSLDVLLFVKDRTAAIREIRRILRPGGRFAFTTWEQAGFSARLDADQIADHRPLLDEIGFAVELYEEPQGWRVQQRTMLESAIVHEAELRDEIGDAEATAFVDMARGALREMPDRRYVLAVYRRR